MSCMVSWTTGKQDSRWTVQHICSCRPQYRYGCEQHVIAPPDNAFTQIPVALQEQYPYTEQGLVDGQSRYGTAPPGRPFMYSNDIEVGCAQPKSLAIELNIDGLLEYQEQRRCATSEEKESLTPAQRRRKAQNRTAYVSGSPIYQMTPVLIHYGAYSQRASTNRKRQRVQELETQLSASELRANLLESNNKRLKHELLQTQNEKEFLRNITRSQPSSSALQSA
jgi:hypothetical protein